MGLKLPETGQLISLDVADSSNLLSGAKKLLKGYPEEQTGISTWDASSIFFEMHGFGVPDRPSSRTLVLLYAADLFFRLRWEIIPALEDGRHIVAAPYTETGLAFGAAAGLSRKWLVEVFRFAPKAAESYRLNGVASTKLGASTSGFVEFCSNTLNQDLRPKFAAYFDHLERRGRCRALKP